MMPHDDQEVIGVGILGAANIARKTFRALNASRSLRVVAVGSRSLQKAESLIEEFAQVKKGETHGVNGNISSNRASPCRAYGSYEEVLNDPNVDVVYMPLPSALHLHWVEKAAEMGKSILLEKPIAVNPMETTLIIEACEKSGVQLMDGTMWMHHPRTKALKMKIDDGQALGDIKEVTATFTFTAPSNFEATNIRASKTADPLGALGDLGWYCVRAILWAFDYEVPVRVIAHEGATFNREGVPMQLGATLLFENGKRGHFQCGFDRALTQSFEIAGTLGTLRVDDFVIPFNPNEAEYLQTSNHGFCDDDTWDCTIRKRHVIHSEQPQEVLMWEEMSTCVRMLKSGGQRNDFWTHIAYTTQHVINRVMESVNERKSRI